MYTVLGGFLFLGGEGLGVALYLCDDFRHIPYPYLGFQDLEIKCIC